MILNKIYTPNKNNCAHIILEHSWYKNSGASPSKPEKRHLIKYTLICCRNMIIIYIFSIFQNRKISKPITADQTRVIKTACINDRSAIWSYQNRYLIKGKQIAVHISIWQKIPTTISKWIWEIVAWHWELDPLSPKFILTQEV